MIGNLIYIYINNQTRSGGVFICGQSTV